MSFLEYEVVTIKTYTFCFFTEDFITRKMKYNHPLQICISSYNNDNQRKTYNIENPSNSFKWNKSVDGNQNIKTIKEKKNSVDHTFS